MVKIEKFQKGILFESGDVKRVLGAGRYFIIPSTHREMVVFSERDPMLVSEKLDVIVKSGLLSDYLEVVDLKDSERALIWVDNRFHSILGPGLYAFWNKVRDIRVEVISTQGAIFEHREGNAINCYEKVEQFIQILTVEEGQEGLFFYNGTLERRLASGRYYFWKDTGEVKLYIKDLREKNLDISGQEIMTLDNLTLRVNALLSYNITDSLKAVMYSENLESSLYKEAQLVLRAAIGVKELDQFLNQKDGLEQELKSNLEKSANRMGIRILNFGVKDIILPGDMKELLNKVTEAKKSAEANLIVRREEVAAIRSQLNTAKILKDNPALMRMKEWEILEKIAQNSNMNLFLGNEKLKEKFLNLI